MCVLRELHEPYELLSVILMMLWKFITTVVFHFWQWRCFDPHWQLVMTILSVTILIFENEEGDDDNDAM